MAESYKEYIGDGTTHQFAVPFPYIDKSHVHLYIDGVEDITFTWITSGTIQATTIPAYGSLVTVRRETPSDERLVDFTDTSMLQEETLDRDSQQNFYRMQEMADFDGNKLAYDPLIPGYDAKFKRLVNVANPINSNDAVNKAYYEGTFLPQMQAWEARAEQWAEEDEDVEVETGKYSAKHWMLKAEDQKILADAAKKAAQTAQANAELAETNLETAVSNAKDAEANAKDAEANALAHKLKAQDWAEEDYNTPVEPGLYSAKHWATQANNIAAGITDLLPGFRNKIIGGDFTTNPWQRGDSFTNVVYGQYTADRFMVAKSGSFTLNVLKTADCPPFSDTGIASLHCLHVDVTTAKAYLADTNYVVIEHLIEGYNAAPFGFGQTGTRHVTLSFWVKATKTGTYCVSFGNYNSSRTYVAEYVVNASNAWEKKIITIPVDTDGIWDYTTQTGLGVHFAIAVGQLYQAPAANTWNYGKYLATSNQVNGVDADNNDFKLAFIQLEAGSAATAFEQRSAAIERILCQRYYECNDGAGLIFSGDVVVGQTYYTSATFRVSKRETPIINISTYENISFPDSGIIFYPNIGGFIYYATANSTGPGRFIRTWAASAEL